MGGRRGFGEVERRRHAGGRVTFRARYMVASGARFSRTFEKKMDAEAWLSAERHLLDRDEWTSPDERRVEAERREAVRALNTLEGFAESYLTDPDRALRPSTVRGYRQLLDSRILPRFGDVALIDIKLADIRAWRASMDPRTAGSNAAAYRLLHSLLQAAEEAELIDRAPPRVRGASAAKVRRVAVPATLDELSVITDQMPENLRLFIVLAAFVGLREGELLELRRGDIDGVAGLISVTRKVEKDTDPSAPGACASCGRVIGAPKTASGTRRVHVPPPFLPMLRAHLLKHTAPGPDGLVFPGERVDHMSVRYLQDRFRKARAIAGREDLTIHHLRHTALTIAGQHGATAAELQARAGHASQAAMAIYQHGTEDRDRTLAVAIGVTYEAWNSSRE